MCVTRLNSYNPVDTSVSIKKPTNNTVITKTSNEPQPNQEVNRTAKEDLQIQASQKANSGAFNFVENDAILQTNKTSIKDSINQLEAQLKTQPLTAENKKVISEKISDLSKFLNGNKIDNNEKINQVNNKINNILVSLKISGADTDKLNNHVNQLIFSVNDKVSKDNGLDLRVVSKQDHILGLESKNKNLTEAQREKLEALKNAYQTAESIKAQKPGNLDKAALVLLSVRDELIRQSFERTKFALPDNKQPNIVETDLKIISNMVSSVDNMLKGTREVPPNMLKGLSDMTKALSDAPVGQMDKALKDFGDALKTDLKAPNAGQLNNLPNTKPLTDLNKQLTSLADNTPTGVADNVNSVMQNYTKAMNSVEKSLPPFLPFPVTIGIPLGYNDGSGNAFMLGSGSKLSQSGSGFQIQAPSMLMQNGDTQVLAGNTQIQLGNKLDYLSMGNLNVKTGGTDTNLTNATAQIDRDAGTSMIKADKAVVNMTDGKVDLTNAGLYQNADGSTNLKADSFWYEKGNDHVGIKNFNALQKEDAQKSIINISGNTLDVKKGDTLVTADKMSFNMEKDKVTGASLTSLSGEKIRVLQDGTDISADKADLKLIKNADGSSLTQIDANNPNVNLKNGSNLNVKGNTNISVLQGSDGKLKNINAKADEVNFSDKTNTAKVVGGNLNVNYDDSGKIKDLTANATDVNFKNATSNITAKNSTVMANYKDGKIDTLAGKVETLNYTNKQGKLDVANGEINSKFNPDGSIDNLNGKFDNLAYNNTQGNLNVDKCNFTGKFNPDGTLANLSGGADKLSYLSNKGDKIDAKGFGLDITNGKNGIEKATVNVGQLDYLSSKGDKLNVIDGKLGLTRDQQGFISNINGEAKNLTYNGKNGDNVNASGLNININGNKNGLTDASIKADEINYNNLKGDNLNVTNGDVNISKDNNGFISKVTGNADKILATNKNGDVIQALGVKTDLTRNAQGTYDLATSADKVNADLKKQGLNLDATKLNLNVTDTNIKLHVDSAELKKKIESDLKVKVENMDLLIDKTKEGALKGADLQLEKLDGSIKGMDLMVRTQNGDRVRLNMSMSEDGAMLKEAFLQIPKGGEVKISKENMNVTLGEQVIKFTQNNGIYTLRDEGMNIAAQFKGGKVSVQGGTAQLSMDTKSGNLFIDEIKGTKINADFGKNKLDIDIKEISNFMVKTTGLSGDVKGLSFELVPTKDSSKITMSMRADIGGVPVKVDLKDVHHLKASADIGVNRAHVYFGDVSKRGNVSISSGPLKMEGSAIEFLAKYNTYNPERMMSSVSRYMSNEGLKAGPLTLEADGVVRLEKQSSGLHLGAAVLVPRVWEDKAYDIVGMNQNRVKDGTWGAVLSVGGQGRSGDGTKYTGALYGGLVPGSYFELKQLQGTTSVYNVPLPKDISLPTTVMGGLMFRRENDTSRLSATVGGYVNPVGLLPKDPSIPLRDNTMYGGFAGVAYKTGNTQFSLDALVDVNKNADTGKTEIAPAVRAGLSFQF
ncbi:MAG: hypothetical protein U0457_19480 [Candidatus Sericytochromatia bacterium]